MDENKKVMLKIKNELNDLVDTNIALKSILKEKTVINNEPFGNNDLNYIKNKIEDLKEELNNTIKEKTM